MESAVENFNVPVCLYQFLILYTPGNVHWLIQDLTTLCQQVEQINLELLLEFVELALPLSDNYIRNIDEKNSTLFLRWSSAAL